MKSFLYDHLFSIKLLLLIAVQIIKDQHKAVI